MNDEVAAENTQPSINVILQRATIKGTMIVRRADGTVKYDNPELAGTYGEDHSTNQRKES